MTTVNIDHPHAEVIAAYYSGKEIEYFESGWWKRIKLGDSLTPRFSNLTEYRIKPEPLVRWLAVQNFGTGVQFYTEQEASAWVASLHAPSDYRIIRMVEQPE